MINIRGNPSMLRPPLYAPPTLCQNDLLSLMGMCRYLNDVYTLEIREGTSLQWVCPNIEGPAPCPRESPAAVTVGTNRLLIYGGMNGKRLGDVWILDVGKQLYMYLMPMSMSH